MCETDLIAGLHDGDIDLTDDQYLSGEDIEGTWSSNTDPTNQISNPGDSIINLREIYDYLYQTNPRFGCATYTYSYLVETRATLANCQDKISDVIFTFLEYVRPFTQNTLNNEFCEGLTMPATINLYDYIEFTTENGTLYDYPNENGTNWEFVSGPSTLGVQHNTGQYGPGGINWNEAFVSGVGYTTPYRTEGEINLLGAEPGTYVFRYSVLPTHNCLEIPDMCQNSVDTCQHPCNPETTDITIIIHPNNYAGENTSGIDFCEGVNIDETIDLISLLNTDGIQDPIYVGPLGVWTDVDSGQTITNPYTLPSITGQQTFNFIYNTNTPLPTPNGCPDEATLTFTVYEPNDPGTRTPTDLCTNNGVVNLIDFLEGNPDSNGTWSGPNGYNSSNALGPLDTANAFSGDYTYTVPANGTCLSDSTTFYITILPQPNTGTNQSPTAICSTLNTIDLLTLVDANADAGGTFVNVSGTTGILSGSIVTITDLTAGTYDFEYQIASNGICSLQTSTITLTIETPLNPGTATPTVICANGSAIDLFDSLSANALGNPDANGTWSGPAGYTSGTSSAVINPSVNVSGNYIYTLPENGNCASTQASVSLTINPAQDAGSNQTETVCQSDGIIDLMNLIDPMADAGGIFIDLGSTGVLSGSMLDVSNLPASTYNFTYELGATSTCSSDSASLSVTILTVSPPTTENQTFCINQGATISSLSISNAQEYSWYDTETSNIVLDVETLLVNGGSYFAAAIDSNGCESGRIEVTVTLLPLSNPNCDDGVGDGISDNDDGENEELDLGGLPNAYPNFEIEIFNRYGTVVYKGNINTTPFDGSGNVSLTLGKKLPTGVYFYVFNPKDEVTEPFQGDFYLSR